MAVHPDQACLFDGLRQHISVDRQEDMDWIFSWAVDRYERVVDDLEDDMENWAKQKTRWPLAAPTLFDEAEDA